MERLSGLDAGFLYLESPGVHMHTLKIAVLDPSTVPGGYTFERFKEELGARLHLLPPFRRRAVPVPLGLHDPVWVDDADFDLDRHVQRVAVPAPGGRAEMDEVIAEVASRPLDRGRPLWSITVLEGLADGRIGFVARLHHALADGVAAAELLANVTTREPEPTSAAVTVTGAGVAPVESEAPPESGWSGEPAPTRRRLVLDALVDRFKMIRRLPALLWLTLRNLVAVVRRSRAPTPATPRPGIDAPSTIFNRSLGPDRSFATASIDFERVRAVKNDLGVTVNDVLLAMVTGSLHGYLRDRGALPDDPLVAGVPVSTDRPDDVHRLGGNRVSNLFTVLPTHIEDPAERVRIIHEVTAEAKVVQNLLGVDMLAEWSAFTGRPYGWLMRQYSRAGVVDHTRPMINLVVSNVPGPREHLYVAGARMDAIYSVGPILEGIGLNVTAWSYGDHLNVGILSCRDHLCDPEAIAAGLEAALIDLEAIAPEGVNS